MKHRSSHRQIYLLAALICLALVVWPFSAKPLFAQIGKLGPETALSFPTALARHQHQQVVEPTAPAQPNSSINIYIFLPIATALPLQTRQARINATPASSTFPSSPQSLNIYIFLPAIAR